MTAVAPVPNEAPVYGPSGWTPQPVRTRLTDPYLKGQLAALNTGTSFTPGTGPGSFTSRAQYTTGTSAVSDLRLYFSNWAVSESRAGEIAVGNVGTVKAAIEFNSTTYPVWFPTGTRSVALDDGAEIESLPVSVEIPANTNFNVRVYYAYTGHYPINNCAWPVASFQTTDLVDATGVLSSPANNQTAGVLFMPTAITGSAATRVPTVAILGDSIAKGKGDTPQHGYIRRALQASAIPSVCFAAASEEGANYLTSHDRRGRFLSSLDYAIDSYGTNDIQVNLSLATIQANLLLRAVLCVQRGLRFFTATVGPFTTSTDSWVTTGNQTNAYTGPQQTIRASYNQWVRAGAPIVAGAAVAVGTGGALLAGQAGHPVTGTFDPAILVETTTDSGIWKAPAALTADGIHPNVAGVALMQPSVPVSQIV